jgi:hypothetical protein
VVRQRSAKPSSAGSIPAVASNFSVPPAFSFPATVESHGWYRLAPFRWSRDEGVLRRNEVLDGAVTELAISFRNGALHVRGAKRTAELTARMTRMFQLHVADSSVSAITVGSTSATPRW